MPSLTTIAVPTTAIPGESSSPASRFISWLTNSVQLQSEPVPLSLPQLKVGMLDNLVEQSSDVARADQQLQNFVLKCHDTISQLQHGNESLISAAETVHNKPALLYMQQAEWDANKYRLDRSISSLLQTLQNDAESIDTDFRQQLALTNALRQQIQTLDAKFEGDLSVRSLDFVVKPTDLVKSEFLSTVLVVVPLASEKEFVNGYETFSEMVVPRSALKLSADKSFALYSVTVFKKFVAAFEQQLREHKFIIREAPHGDEGPQSSTTNGTANRAESLESETQLRSEFDSSRRNIEKLAKLTFSDLVVIWQHIRIIRVFVESVLRYGLQTDVLACSFVPVSKERADKVLMDQFAYLGGNAVERDTKGRVLQETPDLAEYAGLIEQDYKPFVIYSADLP